MKRSHKSKGFTIIELMLAMGFVSTLLLAIAMTIIQVGKTYNSGLILNQVNQVGQTMSAEMQRSIQASSGLAPVRIGSTTTYQPSGTKYRVDEFGGRLCLGQYSYVWNYAKTVATGSDPQKNKFENVSDGAINFLKVTDAGGYYCRGTDNKSPSVKKADAVDMLASGNRDLAIHTFNIQTSSSSIDTGSHQILYVVNFTIGTTDVNAIKSDYSACKDPSETGADPEYCVIRQFTLAVRANNAVN